MSKYKSKDVRLVDIIGLLTDRDMIVVMFKNGTNVTHSNYVRTIRTVLDDYMGCKVVGLTAGGALTVLIED